MAERFIDVTLRFNDKASAPLASANAKLADSAKQWMRAGSEITKTGRSIEKVGASLTSKITAPIAAMGTAAVTNFGDVDKTMRLVESTMGESAWAAADLEGALKSAAASSVFTMEEAADATLNFARQGFDAADAADMLTPALDLAAGTATDLSEVTAGLGNTLKVFEGQGLTATQAADVFARAQAQANTSTTDLFEAMAAGSSIFDTVGWSMQDLAALTGVFGDNFISGSEGATALKTGLARLAEPTDKASAWMDRLGLDIFDASGEMRSMVDVQEQLHSAFAGLTEQEQMQAASALFGKNQMNKWLAVIRTAPDTVQDYRSALDDAAGTANDMANSLMSGVGGSIEKLKSTFDVFSYSVGGLIAEPVQQVVDKVTEFIDRFNSMDEAAQKTIVKYAAFAAAVGPSILVFGKGVKTIGGFITKVGKFGKALSAAGSLMGMITSPAGIAVTALAGIVAAGVLVCKNWDKVKNTAKNVFGYVSGVFEGVGVTSDGIKSKMAELGEHFTGLGSHAKDLWQVVKPAFGAIGDIVQLVFGSIFGAVFGAAVATFGDAARLFGDTADSILSIFDGVVVFLTGVFTGNWSKAWDGIKSIFGGTFGALGGLAKSSLNSVTSLINGVISGINNLGISIPDWVPGLGGKSFSINIPMIPQLAKGTRDWRGGLVQVHERGGEIIDLPRGSRVYPHDKSVQMAKTSGFESAFAQIKSLFGRVTEPQVTAIAQRTERESADTGGIERLITRLMVNKPEADETRQTAQQPRLDRQQAQLRHEALRNTINLTVAKLADQIVVREDADIEKLTDRLVDKLAKKLEAVADNLGGDPDGYIPELG